MGLIPPSYLEVSISDTQEHPLGVMLIAASSHIENENEMTEHTDALKILILQLLLG